MIRSMTGYGRAQEVLDGLDITVEIKSVNHRYFEFSARTPRAYGFLDEKIKSYLQSRVNRGKVDVYVNVENNTEEAVSVTLNQPVAAGYMEALRTMADTFGLESNVSIDLLAKFPDVFKVDKVPEDLEELTADIHAVTEEALRDFDAMRSREGEKLEADLLGRLVTLENFTHQVEQRSPQTVADYRARLTAKLQEVLADRQLDESRVLTEAAIFADKVAVDEETVRLHSHIAQFREMLAGGSPIGRKLDFLIQEMNRETNTIGSKCNNLEISTIVVNMKAEIEKIREQVQNIE